MFSWCSYEKKKDEKEMLIVIPAYKVPLIKMMLDADKEKKEPKM